MDFRPEEEAFRKEVRDFIESELPEWWQDLWSGSEERWEFARQFCAKLGKKGWLTIAWPKEYGGQEASVWKDAVIREEMAAYGEPRGPQYMSLNYIGPAIMNFGTEEQKKKFLPAIARGELNWCQGFSEPDAGSDLAGIKTRAVEDGDFYIINGQKTWTSYGAVADYCLLLARTDPNLPRHRGFSMFLVDMKTPGVTPRRMRDLAGAVEDTCDTFFDDARVHKSSLLGEKNKGWYVAMTAANFERRGNARYYRANTHTNLLIKYAKETKRNGRPLYEDAPVRHKITDLFIRYKVARLLSYRIRSRERQGEVVTIEGPVDRLHNVLLERDSGRVGMEVLGLYSGLKSESKYSVFRGKIYRNGALKRCSSVAVGGIEIQKNIVAERVLGLPRCY